MQLGELQNQIERFNRRGVSILALSVDQANDSLAMIERLGLSFALGADPQQQVIQAFRVQNPSTQELAIHAVYILDQQGEVYYRKVGRRRPVSNELIDAIDAHRGRYPQHDAAQPRRRITVAYPENNFQALISVSQVAQLPATIDRPGLLEVSALIEDGRGDDAVIALTEFMRAQQAGEQDLLDAAAWLTRRLFFADNPEAIALGQDLRRRLDRVTELETQLAQAADETAKDAALHALARARGGLSLTRSKVNQQAQAWRLRSVKTSLRSFREVARAALRSRAPSTGR